MSIRFVTDSTSDLTPEMVRRWGITVVPVYVNFSDDDGQIETLKDGLDITADAFYERLGSAKKIPTTSQPTIQDFLETYEELTRHNDDLIISVHVSSKLSGTHNSALQAKRSLRNPARVEVIDSGTVSMGLGLAVLAGARAAQAGSNANEVIQEIETACSQMRIYFAIDDLEYLQRGGRIGKAQAFLGSLLSLKPILSVEDGEVRPLERVRSRSRALRRLAQIADGLGGISEACIIYNTTPDDADTLSNNVRRLLPPDRITMSRPTCSLGVHTGPGLIGIVTRTGG